MRIRNSSSSITSTSSFSSDSTSLTPSTTHSFSSSTSNASFSTDYITRCEGLDLLIKAVLHVAGSVLVVPFTQRRVIRRRKRACKFTKIEFIKKPQEDEQNEEEEDEEIDVILNDNKRKREMSFPKYHDSVIQPWKRCTRRRTSLKINRTSG
ncbi:hypothetical protein FRX31_026680 [Thalictrum thalictroides]|uniref:Uncharacterized protein n=1 Tax=Thalictrum thalictroides TaxID=46969 RepID=A0A7J6VHG4_THATH|nr:hypothetical protein FRX31_026680 [Thalictrum thalictroides]